MGKIGRRFSELSVLVAIVLVLALGFGVGAQAEERVLRVTFSWPTHIDPAVGSDYSSSTALVNLYDTLVYPTPDGQVIPHLAEDWEISADNLTYTFSLSPDVKFHDGRALTAADVKFSVERLDAIGEGFAYLFRGKITDVEVIDDHTVAFRLAEPFGPFLSTLARLYIVNSELVKENLADGPHGDMGDYGRSFLNEHDAGSGAYMVKEFDVGSELILERFEDYFGEVHPNAPDIFHMIGTTEAATVRTWMSRGELEITDQWQTAEAFASLEAMPGVDIGRYPDGGQLYLMLNTQVPPLDDVHVRRALAYLIDYDALTTNIFPGTDQAAGPVSRVLPGWNPDVTMDTLDLDRARQELEQSQYHGELQQYTIKYAWTAEVPDLEKVSLMLQAYAGMVGLDIDVVRTPWLTMIDQAGSVDTTPHITSIWVAPHYGEAGSILESKYHSSNVGSWEQTEWLQNPEVDRLIERALATVDFDERMALYGQVQELIVDLMPSVFLYDNVSRHAYQSTYVEWPQLDDPHPVMGHMFDVRFIAVYPERR